MTAPPKPWETSNGMLRSSNPNPMIPQSGTTSRGVPALPPRPNSIASSNYSGNYNSYMPYSGLGGYNSYSSMPFGSMYNSYGSYGNYGGYGYNNYNNLYGMGGGYGNFGGRTDAEGRFIQFAEESTRSTFANVENVVRAFSSIAMMLDNTFFAMTSSFRAVLSVAENFGRLRSIFGQIWYSINLFRLFKWLYRKFMGYEIMETASGAWDQAATGVSPSTPPGGSNWPTLAFFGLLISAPYLISKLLPKYEDKSIPEKWKSPGVRAKAAFDFIATNSNELSLQTNDNIMLAPKYIQDEMKLTNTGWAFAVCNGRSGVVPLNYIVIIKKVNSNSSRNYGEELPVPKLIQNTERNHEKKVTFGTNQIITIPTNENIDNHTESKQQALMENLKDKNITINKFDERESESVVAN